MNFYFWPLAKANFFTCSIHSQEFSNCLPSLHSFLFFPEDYSYQHTNMLLFVHSLKRKKKHWSFSTQATIQFLSHSYTHFSWVFALTIPPKSLCSRLSEPFWSTPMTFILPNLLYLAYKQHMKKLILSA